MLRPDDSAGLYGSSKAAVHTLSETLRHELAPFGVRVVTCVAGGVRSHVWANFAERDDGRAWELPPGSRYAPATTELGLLARGQYVLPGAESAEKFAKDLVEDVLVGATGKVFRGSEAGLTKWLLPVLPTWLMVRTISSGSGSVSLSILSHGADIKAGQGGYSRFWLGKAPPS